MRSQHVIPQELKDEIISRLMTISPRRIVLFGSHATGTATPDSDIDLYVVTDDAYLPVSWSEKNAIYLKVARQLRDFMRQHPTDLIAHSEAMHKRFVELNSSFARDIMHKGVVLYESSH